MTVKIIFLIIGIIFWVVRSMNKGDNNAPKTPGKRPKKAPRPASAKQSKSIDDIFNDFVKEVENSKKKQVQQTKPKPVAAVAKKVKREKLDWQQVETTHIKPKKQLIDHEDYHHISHRVDEAHQLEKFQKIEDTEGQVFEFNIDNVDWRQAIIAKEILDKPYA